jgi:hypothetical protein
MKNQYFGDQNDYFKYDLLIFLAEQLAGIKRLTMVWLLTSEDKSGDGGKRGYPTGTYRDTLHEFLESSNTRNRKVSFLKDYIKKPQFSFEFCSYGDELKSDEFKDDDREAYFARISPKCLKSAIVFLDPDNGLEPKSGSGRNGSKYVKLSDLKLLFSRMDKKSVIVVYQHLPRMHRKLFLYGLHRDLKECLNCPVPISITNNQIAFLVLANQKNKRRQQEINRLLHKYVRSNLQILD